MKNIFLCLLTLFFTTNGFAQSTTLLPGFGEFKSDKIIIGDNLPGSGKLRIGGTDNGYGADINTDELSSPRNIIGLNINTPNSTYSNIGAFIRFGNATQNTGIELIGYNLNTSSSGLNINLQKGNSNGYIYGGNTNLTHNGTGTGGAIGSAINVTGTGTIDKTGLNLLISGSGGNRTGVSSRLAGTDINLNSDNISGYFSNNISNAIRNVGLLTSASGGNTNYGIYATATGLNSYAGYFKGLVHNDGNIINSGFTKLGISGPSIQQKEIELPDNTPTGNFTIVNHAIGNIDKIVSMDVKIYTNTNVYVHENYPSPFRFAYSYDADNITIYNIPSESSGITGTGRKINILITYKE